MTQQEHIDQLIRIHIGDMVVQIVMLKAQIASLETAVAEAQAAQQIKPEEKPEKEIIVDPKPNGKEKRAQDG